MKLIFLSETTRPRALIFCMMHYLVVFYQVVQIIPLRPKMVHPMDHLLYIGLNRVKPENIFLSETIRPRAMIFGM